MQKQVKTRPGKSFPLGATVSEEGTNFCIFSKNASYLELVLFDDQEGNFPVHSFRLNPQENKTFYYWHIFLEGIGHGQHYGWRAQGPFVPEKGLRYDRKKVLIDPYARAVDMRYYDRERALSAADNAKYCIRSIVIDNSRYDWEGDKPLNHPYSKSVIYELHVGGFTRHRSSGIDDRWKGTYRGLIEKIPYLQQLGITTVELLPVQQFDPFDVPNPKLTNYWGYSPIAFFAPHSAYSSREKPEEAVNEFRDMVKALHKAGIEVILDVVFNHTGEGDANGPTLSFKGLENRAYYMLERDNYTYKNFSGTGNTLNANHSVVRRMIRDCLRYWVSEMHVDGFRFDLASVLSRDEEGIPIKNPPILWGIESDPELAPVKLIAEAWDVQQYQLGQFIGDKWAEWNGAYRDDIRRFVKGDEHSVYTLTQRLNGSPDLFSGTLRNPNRSINFVTCHDGFTMHDLVAYNHKHNLANGEGNRDGHNDNLSWNCGVEGPTDEPEILQLRKQQTKNFLTLLLLSQGTPMLLMGDEVHRTQQGNNNAYCQDNEISWFNWDSVKEQKELLSFVQKLIRFNLSNEFFQENYFWNSPDSLGASRCEFHGTSLHQPDFSGHSHSIAFLLKNLRYPRKIYVMVNAYWKRLAFELPNTKGWHWKCIIDTAAPSPADFTTEEKAPIYNAHTKWVAARSVAVMVGREE
jgi:glycogen operon protein